MDMYLFNPDNDMALANFTPYYRPPAEIVTMAEDLALLPAWYALPGSVIKVACKEREEDFLDRCGGICPEVGLSSSWLDMPYHPWGWSPALVHALQAAGVSSAFLPDMGRLDEIRRLSSRCRTREVLDGFSGVEGCCGVSAYATSLEDVSKFLSHHERMILKSPWSGSGRGLVSLDAGKWTSSCEGWVSRIIRTQGGVMMEPFYDKILDFAMEFRSDGKGKVDFVGYSLFDTDSHGNYKGNFLMSDRSIARRLEEYVDPGLPVAVRNSLQDMLAPLAGRAYEGYLGVDMMVCRSCGRYLLHPCVEINLRMNMGVVSHVLYERLVAPGTEGVFLISHFCKAGECLDFCKEQRSRYPLVMVEDRIASGYFALTPVSVDTRYHAYLLVGGCISER